MHRVRSIIAGSNIVAAEKSKSNTVYRIEWEVGEEIGSAWVQTKPQLEQVLTILRSKPGIKAKAETFLIPRDKGGIVWFLNQHGAGNVKPTALVTIDNS